jgi:Putative Ig domain
MTSGSLPAGLSLSSSGTISGSASNTGAFAFTAKVSDSASHNATASLALTVDPSNPNGSFDGPAELPRVYVQSTLASTPANGKTWLVSDSSSLQAALNASACGDTISLQAGVTFTGVFTFPGKSCDDLHWIIVRTSAPDASLPPEGTRISPCYAGVASLPGRPALNCKSTTNVMARLMMTANTGSGPVAFASGANHYRLLGLEITRPANGVFIGNLVFPVAGASGDHIILDRVWMHGTPKDDTTRGLYLSALTYVAVVDSYLNDFHCESNTGTCTDAQTVSGGLGSTPGGPWKIVNNFLESSTEVILFGGGSATATPADIEISHNHFFKPYTWMPGAPGGVVGNHGNPFTVKNHMELKNAQRVLFESNIIENTWGGFSQAGFTIVLTPKNQSSPKGNLCPICQVTDITIRNSTFSHVGGGFQIANAPSDTGGAAFAGERYSIHDVILDDIDPVKYNGQGQLAQVSTSPGSPLLNNVQMTHITAFPSHALFVLGNNVSPKMPNFVFSNSIVTAGAYPIWGVGGGAADCAFNPIVPATVLNNCFTAYTFSSNALLAVPSKYPSSMWPSGNTLMPDGNSVGFVNFNNGNGGDYHLQPGSRFVGAASDGKDVGADINAVTAATAGAY